MPAAVAPVCLAPGQHHVRVVDRDADDVVDPLRPQRVGDPDEARQVLGRAEPGEGAGQPEERDPAGRRGAPRSSPARCPRRPSRGRWPRAACLRWRSSSARAFRGLQDSRRRHIDGPGSSQREGRDGAEDGADRGGGRRAGRRRAGREAARARPRRPADAGRRRAGAALPAPAALQGLPEGRAGARAAAPAAAELLRRRRDRAPDRRPRSPRSTGRAREVDPRGRPAPRLRPARADHRRAAAPAARGASAAGSAACSPMRNLADADALAAAIAPGAGRSSSAAATSASRRRRCCARRASTVTLIEAGAAHPRARRRARHRRLFPRAAPRPRRRDPRGRGARPADRRRRPGDRRRARRRQQARRRPRARRHRHRPGDGARRRGGARDRERHPRRRRTGAPPTRRSSPPATARASRTPAAGSGSRACRTPSTRARRSPRRCSAPSAGYVARPWFWSDQYDVKLQIAGLNAGWDRTVTAPGARPGSQSVWYWQGDRLLAVDAMNDPRAYMTAKRWIEAGRLARRRGRRRPGDRPQGARLMRIIAGRLPRHWRSPRSAPAIRRRALRPTSDRVRESLFNLLAHGAYGDPPPPEGRRVLDLFAGTGALGLEALSRGARQATFVEQGARGAGAAAAQHRPAAGRGGGPGDRPRRDPARPQPRARRSTSSSSTRPMAAASASRRSPRRSPAAGWRRARSSSGRRASTRPRAARLDPARPPPLWGDDDRDLPQHRAAAELRAMTAARRLLGQVFGFPEFRPGQEEIVDAVEAGRDVLADHADRRRQVALLPAARADPARRDAGRSRR